MRTATVLLALVGLVCLSGCITESASMGRYYPGTEELTSNGTWDILPEAEGSSSGGILFGFIPIGIEKKRGVVHGQRVDFSNLLGAVEQAALYNAIESMPGADALMAPRWHIHTENYVIFKRVEATVKGKGVRYNVTAQ